jgi:hypothetical protein
MKGFWRAVIVVATGAAVGCGIFHSEGKTSGEPFYRKYLVPGNPLDDRILEQEQRVAEQPDSADLRNDFGNLLAERRFVEDARNQYEKALELDDTHYLAAYNLGVLWESNGEPLHAIHAFRKSISRKPGFPASHFHLGRLYEQRGWNSKAIQEYAKAMRIDPRMRDPKFNPLAVDTQLLDLASLENYEHDVAAAGMNSGHAWVDEGRFANVPVDRPISSSEVEDLPAPEPIDATVSPSGVAPTPRPPARVPLAPGQTRPQQSGLPAGTPPLLPAGAPPPPTPVPTPVP